MHQPVQRMHVEDRPRALAHGAYHAHWQVSLVEQSRITLIGADDEFERVLELDHAVLPPFIGDAGINRLPIAGPGLFPRLQPHPATGQQSLQIDAIRFWEIKEHTIQPPLAGIGQLELELWPLPLPILELVCQPHVGTPTDWLPLPVLLYT